MQIDVPLAEDMIQWHKDETARLEKFTDRVLAKLSSVITISGILTFVSFGFFSSEHQAAFLNFYLIWILPYLIVGIVLWVFVFKQSPAIIAKNDFFMKSTESKLTIQFLRAQLEMHQGVYNSTHKVYQDTRKLFAYSLSFILAYLLLYLLSFYFFVFSTLPDMSHMILVTIIALLLLFIFRYWYTKGKIVVNIVKEFKLPSASSTKNDTTKNSK